MSCEFGDLIRLRDRLQRMANTNEQFVKECAKELSARLLRKVIKRTPVGQYPPSSGKVGGTLRRGWTGGQQMNVSAYVSSLSITRQGNNYVVMVSNPTQYAPYVEYGHRTRNHRGWVEGYFMLTLSEQEIQASAPAILERKVRKRLEEGFNGQ